MLDTPVCSGPASAVQTTYLASTEPMEHRNDVPEANGPPKFRAIPALCSGIPAQTRRSGVLDRVFYAPFASKARAPPRET
jgi:hypothetical protein